MSNTHLKVTYFYGHMLVLQNNHHYENNEKKMHHNLLEYILN